MTAGVALAVYGPDPRVSIPMSDDTDDYHRCEWLEDKSIREATLGEAS